MLPQFNIYYLYLLLTYQIFQAGCQFSGGKTNRKSGFRLNKFSDKFTIIMRIKRRKLIHAVEAGTF